MLTKTGETLRARGVMYKEVAQSVLLYGSESWVVTGAVLRVLEGFHHFESMRITGMAGKRVTDREWEYPPVVAALEAAGLHSIQEYICRRQTTIVAHVACRPIYELCTKAERRQGAIWMMIWWDQYLVHKSKY